MKWLFFAASAGALVSATRLAVLCGGLAAAGRALAVFLAACVGLGGFGGERGEGERG